MRRFLSNPAARKARRTRLDLECLERRDTPSAVASITPVRYYQPVINYHGGAVLSHVEVQALYLGSDWGTNPALLSQVFQFNAYLSRIVNGPYMDMLTNAGYGVGRGTTTTADLDTVNINKGQFLTDAQIQNDITSQINIDAGLDLPINNGVADANRLYVVFVEPGVAVQAGSETSLANFGGYHSALPYQYQVTGSLEYTGTATVHYAVIPYANSSTAFGTNTTLPWLNTFDSMTEVTSHELAEAVTDPDGFNNNAILNANTNNNPAWVGSTSNPESEVGDLANNNTVYLDGYAVQRIANQWGQAMTPEGATSQTPVDFVLRADGTFWARVNGVLTEKATGVTSISDQGVDNTGQAMVDLVFGNGSSAAEFHEGRGLVFLPVPASGIHPVQAKAGQGVSYVLMSNGNVYEYVDHIGTGLGTTVSGVLASNVKSIDAGTDGDGVNMVAFVRTDSYTRTITVRGRPTTYHYVSSDAYVLSDSVASFSDQPSLIASGVQSVSAGQQGNVAYVTTGGAAYWYSTVTGTTTFEASGVAAITAGTDNSGYLLLDMLFTNGNLSQSEGGVGWVSLERHGGVASIGKAHDGVVDLIFSGGYAYTDGYNGLTFLSSNTKTAA